MATTNTWRQFQELIADEPILTATVNTHNTDGTSTVTLTGGGTARVIGHSVAEDSQALIRGNQIIGEAPNLDSHNLEV